MRFWRENGEEFSLSVAEVTRMFWDSGTGKTLAAGAASPLDWSLRGFLSDSEGLNAVWLESEYGTLFKAVKAAWPAFRERRTVTASRITGQTTVRREIIPDTKPGWEERLAGLRAQALADLRKLSGTPVQFTWCALECDGCGTRVQLDTAKPRYPEGWRERPGGDFCPACLRKRGAAS